MEQNQKIEDATFGELKLIISKWFDKSRRVNMKVLYRDHIPNISELRCFKMMQFIDLLIGSGNLSQSDVTILYDTIAVTKQFGLEKELRRQLPSLHIPDLRNHVVTHFTPHRQRLVKFGMILSQCDVNQISGLYDLKKYNEWSLIQDLEHRMIICEENMEEFIEKLKKQKLLQAVKPLTEGAVISVTLCEHRQSSSAFGNQPSAKTDCDDSHSSLQPTTGEPSHAQVDETQPPATAIHMVKNLHRNKDTFLMLGDKEIAYSKLRKIISYYQQHGFQLEKTTSGSLVFHLFTYDSKALISLWEIHQSGKLVKDLAKILAAEEDLQEFTERWKTRIDELKYKAAVNKLEKESVLKYYVLATLHRKGLIDMKRYEELKQEMKSEEKVIKTTEDESWRMTQNIELENEIEQMQLQKFIQSVLISAEIPRTDIESQHPISQEQLPVSVEDIDDISNSLIRFCCQVLCRREITDKGVIEFMKYRQFRNMSITEMKFQDIGKVFTHALIAAEDEDDMLCFIRISCTDDVVRSLSAECDRLRFRYTLKELHVYCNPTFNLSLLNHLLSNAPMLHKLVLSNGVLSGTTVNDIVDELTRQVRLNLNYLDIHCNGLNNIKGSSLCTVLTIAPELKHLDISDCNLSGVIMDDLINECSMKGVKLELDHLDIGHNNLNKIKGSSLGTLFAIAPKLAYLDIRDCNLEGAIVDDMVSECTMKGVVLELGLLNYFDIHCNNLNNMKGSTLGTLLTIAPELKHLDISDCNLSGAIMDDMINECTMKGVVLQLVNLDIHCNNLNTMKSTTLGTLLTIAPKLEYLNMNGCNLSAAIVDGMINECTMKGVLLQLNYLGICYSNLSDIKSTTLGTLLTIAPKLAYLNMKGCDLSVATVEDMINECTEKGVVLELVHLNISNNNLKTIKGSSLITLFAIAPKLIQLRMLACSLPFVTSLELTKNVCYTRFVDAP